MSNELLEREQKFKSEVFAYTAYENLMLEQFFDYWSEPNRLGKKMRWELEKTWDLNKRLKRWNNNNLNWKNGQAINSDSNKPHKPGTSEARVAALREWGTTGTKPGA